MSVLSNASHPLQQLCNRCVDGVVRSGTMMKVNAQLQHARDATLKLVELHKL